MMQMKKKLRLIPEYLKQIAATNELNANLQAQLDARPAASGGGAAAPRAQLKWANGDAVVTSFASGVPENAMNDITEHCSIKRDGQSSYFPTTTHKNKLIDVKGNEILLLSVKSPSAFGKGVAAQTKVLEQAVRAEAAKLFFEENQEEYGNVSAAYWMELMSIKTSKAKGKGKAGLKALFEEGDWAVNDMSSDDLCSMLLVLGFRQKVEAAQAAAVVAEQ
jgi:hypothetical protein